MIAPFNLPTQNVEEPLCFVTKANIFNYHINMKLTFLLSVTAIGGLLSLLTAPASAQTLSPGSYHMVSCVTTGSYHSRGIGTTGTVTVTSTGTLVATTRDPRSGRVSQRSGRAATNFTLSGVGVSTVTGRVVYASAKAGYVTFRDGLDTGVALLTRK